MNTDRLGQYTSFLLRLTVAMKLTGNGCQRQPRHVAGHGHQMVQQPVDVGLGEGGLPRVPPACWKL